MSAVLRAYGASFDVDAFLKDSRLSPSRVWRIGEPSSRSGASPNRSSGLTVAVSEAEMSNLSHQIQETVAFLQSHVDELARLVAFAGVDEIGIDFAVSWRDDVVTQTDSLSAELVGLAGRLGLGIDISHYPVSHPH
jgi:hypothetical protein